MPRVAQFAPIRTAVNLARHTLERLRVEPQFGNRTPS
jgi:hypothetical protein